MRTLKPGPQKIKIERISIGDRRQVSKSHVKVLASSIGEIGLQCPIGVTLECKLIHGLHRIRACESLGMKEIMAIAFDLDAMQAELAEIDENICRNELKAIERSKALVRRKEVYETMHPETMKTGPRPKSIADTMSAIAPTFAADTALKTGMSERNVRRDVAIGKAIPDAIAEKIASTRIADNKKQLHQLAKLEPNQQEKAADAIASGKVSTVAEAIATKEKTLPLPVSLPHYDDKPAVAKPAETEPMICCPKCGHRWKA